MKTQKRRPRRYGFTMIEVMAAIILISLLTGVAAQKFWGMLDKAKVVATEANLEVLHNAVVQFYMDTGRWPHEDEGLTAKT